MSQFVLAIDQGTTSSRAIVFAADGQIVAVSQQPIACRFPRNGWVEQDPEEIWQSVLTVGREALAKAGVSVAAVGITNQRETTVLWDRATGAPVYDAIVWQDRRGAELCQELKAEGSESLIRERTGLVADSYFSATKLHWLLELPGIRERAMAGELAFGTIDTFLAWRLTGGRAHATDVTNASRTLIFDIHRGHWDPDLLALFGIPQAMLPTVLPTASDFGTIGEAHFGEPLLLGALVGDQQGALIGQACFEPGMMKSTYGTGAFTLMNTGAKPVASDHGLLTTVAYELKGKRHYALEGSIFNAGTVVQWLRDNLGLIDDAKETGRLAASIEHTGGVHFVPAFTGLGAPHWNSEARGVITGLTRDTGRAEIVRAGLESVVFQTLDLLGTQAKDGEDPPAVLRIDGGMAANDWFMQTLADLCAITVERPRVLETTALGAALAAALTAGVHDSLEGLMQCWRSDRRCEPSIDDKERSTRIAEWNRAVAAALI